MATKNEKTLGFVSGAFIGLLSGIAYLKNQDDIPEKDKWKYIVGSTFGGGLVGHSLLSILGSSNNTVNYSLYNYNKRVYEGITFKNRISSRRREHLKNGKKFTEMIYDNAKPRIEAIILEKKRIKKYKPIYNIQHNN